MTPCRPRLRISLRALLVLVTLVAAGCGWLASELRFVRARREFRVWIESQNQPSRFSNFTDQAVVHYWFTTNTQASDAAKRRYYEVTIPGGKLRWLYPALGDSGLDYTVISEFTDDDLRRIRHAFPRTTITSLEILPDEFKSYLQLEEAIREHSRRSGFYAVTKPLRDDVLTNAPSPNGTKQDESEESESGQRSELP